ncbi:hypothetical protein BIW11_14189, partial [Tropilaelaps mercedesae]
EKAVSARRSSTYVRCAIVEKLLILFDTSRQSNFVFPSLSYQRPSRTYMLCPYGSAIHRLLRLTQSHHSLLGVACLKAHHQKLPRITGAAAAASATKLKQQQQNRRNRRRPKTDTRFVVAIRPLLLPCDKQATNYH